MSGNWSLRLICSALAVSAGLILSNQPASAQEVPSFNLKRDISPANGAYTIAQADFNQDGIPDLVYGGGIQPTDVTIRYGNGDGTFRDPVRAGYGGSSQIVGLAAGDIDHDGRPDIAALNIDGTFTAFFNQGAGNFVPFSIATRPSPYSIALADFNGDGRLDVAVGDQSGVVQIFPNSAGRSFVAGTTYTIESDKPIVYMGAGNFDGNFVYSLSVLAIDGAYMLWNDGAGHFTRDAMTGFTNPSSLSVGDLNQDGRDDVLLTWDCHPELPAALHGPTNSTCMGIESFYGQGNHQLFQRTLVHDETTAAANAVIATDINQDGFGDLVASTAQGNHFGIGVYFGQRDGSFSQTPYFFTATSGDIGGLVAADFNRDGAMDFAQNIPSYRVTEIYLNASNTDPCGVTTISPTVTVCQLVDHTYLPSDSVRVIASAEDTKPVTATQLYANGALIYNQPVNGIDQTFHLGYGSYYLVAKAWDATGLEFRSPRTVTLYSGTPGTVCSTPGLSALVCVPNNASSATPLHIVANGGTKSVPTAAQLYIDNVLVVNDQGCDLQNACSGGVTMVDTYQQLAAGSHYLEYKLWDADGHVQPASRTINVQ